MRKGSSAAIAAMLMTVGVFGLLPNSARAVECEARSDANGPGLAPREAAVATECSGADHDVTAGVVLDRGSDEITVLVYRGIDGGEPGFTYVWFNCPPPEERGITQGAVCDTNDALG